MHARVQYVGCAVCENANAKPLQMAQRRTFDFGVHIFSFKDKVLAFLFCILQLQLQLQL
jgi:hypothetical protein